MSPEQADGRSAILDHRTDIYSLGITLYELLTLRPAFPASDRQTLLRQIAGDEPPAPRRLNPAIPADFETIILKAIAKDPRDRYGTARELANDLNLAIEQKPIKAKPPSTWQRAQKWVRRHQAVAASAFLLLLLARAAFAASTILISKERNSAIAAGEDADRERERAETSYLTARDAVKQMLKQVGDERLGGIREMKEVRTTVLEDAVTFFTKLTEINPRDAQAYAERADALRLLGRFPEALKDYETCLEIDPDNVSIHLAVADHIPRWHINPNAMSISFSHAKRATEIDPGHALARWLYAWRLSSRGEPDKARRAKAFRRTGAAN
jgi:tetratricopeptide (TPR) repeat protein